MRAYQERLKMLERLPISATCCSKQHPACSARTRTCCGDYQQRFKFILVDEYQDTNVAQYLWLRLLSQAPTASLLHVSPRARRSHQQSGMRVRGLSAD